MDKKEKTNTFKIELKNITKTFLNGKIIANNNISLKIKKGEIHTLIGENGSGKSTLMSIILGIYNSDSGEIFLDGKKVNTFQNGFIKKHKIGMVHQHFHLIDRFTVLENIILGQENLKIDKKLKEEYKNKIKNNVEKIKNIISKNEEIKKINEEYLILNKDLKKLKEKLFLLENNKKFVQNKFSLKSLNNKLNKLEEKQIKEINKTNLKIEELKNFIEKYKEENLKLLKEEIKEKEFKISLFDNKELKKVIYLEEENINLREELKLKNMTIFSFLNNKKLIERFEYITKKYKISLNHNTFVKKLSVGERQKVEILKTLWDKKDIIIFDEPTATLSISEIKSLMFLIKELQKEGKTIIFISHKLKEIREISDRISILRKGELVETFENSKELKNDKITSLMVGKKVELKFVLPKPTKKPILKIKNLTYLSSKGFMLVDNVSFEINEGEIFGLAGIEGNGQEELFDSISGIKKPSKKSEIFFKEIDLKNKSTFEKNKYFSHIPIDRLRYGIVPNETLKFNSIITNFFQNYISGKFLNEKIRIINSKKTEELTEKIINNLNVEGAKDLNIPIRNLSGGNQQKFVISRELLNEHEILLAGHPTRGLDINSINNIYNAIIKNSIGKATLLYSLEISELISVCHRIAIMYKGKIIDIIDPKKYDINSISKMMVGLKDE